MKKTVLKSLMLGAFVFMATHIFAQSGENYKEKIEKLNKEMVKAMISGDQSKIMSFYASDVISLPNYEKMLEGIDALRKSNEAMRNAGWKVKSFEPVTLKVSSCEKLITEIGTFKISFTVEGMDQPIEDVGKYVTIWEKQKDGSLKIKIEMWNSDVNPMDNKM